MKYYVTSHLSENMHETPEGFLLCIGVSIARTGEMIYAAGETPLEVGEDGQVVIDRQESEVFRPETIASFEGKPVTITHPTDFVDPSNWSRLAKGILQNVRRGKGEQSNDLVADLLITDNTAIHLVKNGLREVSCGYEAEYSQTDEGHGMQTNIIGNHLALVDKGRAGSGYAIRDHQGKGALKMSMKDKIKSIFAKAQDEAMKAAEDAGEEIKKEEKKAEDKEEVTMDLLVQACKDLGEKLDALKADKESKDAEEEKADKKDDGLKMDKEEEKAGDEEVAPAIEDRLKALEASVAKILEKFAGEEESEGEDADAEEAEGDLVGDDDMEEGAMTGDTMSRVEILAPGLKAGKDVKKAALQSAYKTVEGKKIIESLTGGKAPAFDSASAVDTLFVAASEILKQSRNTQMSATKLVRDSQSTETSQMKSAAEINEFNAKFYGKK